MYVDPYSTPPAPSVVHFFFPFFAKAFISMFCHVLLVSVEQQDIIETTRLNRAVRRC